MTDDPDLNRWFSGRIYRALSGLFGIFLTGLGAWLDHYASGSGNALVRHSVQASMAGQARSVLLAGHWRLTPCSSQTPSFLAGFFDGVAGA